MVTMSGKTLPKIRACQGLTVQQMHAYKKFEQDHKTEGTVIL